MNEALILERLDRLSDEVKSLKADVLSELKQELGASPAQEANTVATPAQNVVSGPSNEKVLQITQTLLTSLEQLNDVISKTKTGASLEGQQQALISTKYPDSIRFFNELDADFHIDELIVLLRKALTNLDTMGEAIDMLAAGVELRNDLVPILQLMYPRVLRFLNSLYEGEFQAEELGDLLHTILINVHTLSDLLNMIQPMTELVKEVGVVMKETDVIHGVNVWLDSLQHGNGLVKLVGIVFTALKKLDFNETQIDEICKIINETKLNQVEPVSPFGMVKQLKDPKVQEALGFLFKSLQVIGSCLQAFENGNGKHKAANA